MLRRLITRWLPVVAIATATAAALAIPTTASAAAPVAACPAIYPRPAYCDGPIAPGPVLASTNHVGWVYLNLNYCAPGMMCTHIYRMSTTAWSWSGSAWSQTQLNGGWVYVYPYSGAWRWTWTQESGWLAISGGRFEVRSSGYLYY